MGLIDCFGDGDIILFIPMEKTYEVVDSLGFILFIGASWFYLGEGKKFLQIQLFCNMLVFKLINHSSRREIFKKDHRTKYSRRHETLHSVFLGFF